MARHNDTGAHGETAALAYLAAKGYRLLHRNWRHGRDLELDLVLADGHETVVVEVKTLTQGGAFRPEHRIGAAKRRKLREAAEAYVALEGITGIVRFDVVTLAGSAVTHYVDVPLDA